MSGFESLTTAHWLYLAGVSVILLTMTLRVNVLVPSIIATFAVAFAYTGSPVTAVATIFNASFVAAKELFNIFLVIALMTALLNALKVLSADTRMVQPFRAVMHGGGISYVVLAAVTYVISLFFWPTPAVPLVAAILLPAAIIAGLPPLGGAVAIAIAGQGMALSSDYVIGIAPGITAKAAGVSALVVADRALVLSLITGIVALIIAYLSIRKHVRPASQQWLIDWQRAGAAQTDVAAHMGAQTGDLSAATAHSTAMAKDDSRIAFWSRLFAIATPAMFLIVIGCMVLPRFIPGLTKLQGGEAAALIGGTAALLMVLASAAAMGWKRAFEVAAEHTTDGLVFAFRAMGAVLPIAGFFFMGGSEVSSAILQAGDQQPNLLGDLVQAVQGGLPRNEIITSYGVMLFGMITGIDGSGFAGLPLIGSLASALGPATGIDPATLCAIGMMGSIWTGGGTLVAWSSLIAVTGFCRVDVQDAVRVIFLPVVIGLVVSTLAAIFLW